MIQKIEAVRIYYFLLLILFLSSCEMQKRHYRKGWTINWRTEKNSKNDISKTKDSLHFKDSENTISTTNNDLNLITGESVLVQDTILIESKKSVPKTIPIKNNPIKLELIKTNPKIPLNISVSDDTKKVKTGEEKYFIFAFVAFFASVLTFIIFASQILGSTGIKNASNGKVLVVFFIALFLVLMVVFIILGFKKRRNFINNSNSNSAKEQRLIEKKNRRSEKAELASVGIVNRTKLWLLLAGIIVVIAIAALFLIEDGALLAIMAILPFIAFICVAILEFFRYKKNAIAYEHGEYDPEKFLNRTKKKKKKT